MAHEVLYAHTPLHRISPEHAQPIADLPPELACEARYLERHDHFTTTTNLAVARHIIASGLLDDADWRVRLEMMRQLNAVMGDTIKEGTFFKDTIPDVIVRYESETSPLVRESMLGVIETAIH